MLLRTDERDDSSPSDQHDVQHLLNLNREPPPIFLARDAIEYLHLRHWDKSLSSSGPNGRVQLEELQ